MTQMRIGCSGFYNRHWKGLFYPEAIPQSKWFEFYAKHLNSLELNVTFYRFPTLASLQKWYQNSPTEFMFAVKAPRAITHFKKLVACETLLHDFYTACEQGLREKLGCVLFQFPPSFHFSLQNLETVLHNLNPAFNNVIEFRHVSWWNEDVYLALQQQHLTFCSVSHPTLPDDIIINNTMAYIRIHGSPTMFYSAYNSAQQMQLYEKLLRDSSLKDAYIFFNNTAGTAGILNALEMKYITEIGED